MHARFGGAAGIPVHEMPTLDAAAAESKEGGGIPATLWPQIGAVTWPSQGVWGVPQAIWQQPDASTATTMERPGVLASKCQGAGVAVAPNPLFRKIFNPLLLKCQPDPWLRPYAMPGSVFGARLLGLGSKLVYRCVRLGQALKGKRSTQKTCVVRGKPHVGTRGCIFPPDISTRRTTPLPDVGTRRHTPMSGSSNQLAFWGRG